MVGLCSKVPAETANMRIFQTVSQLHTKERLTGPATFQSLKSIPQDRTPSESSNKFNDKRERTTATISNQNGNSFDSYQANPETRSKPLSPIRMSPISPDLTLCDE